MFNIADYVGKQLAVWIQKPGPSKWGQLSLLVSSILRIGFIPLFMFCNVSVNNRETNILIHSDVAYIVLMLLFGISNGYIGNIAMMFGPGTVKDPKYGVSDGDTPGRNLYMYLPAWVILPCVYIQLHSRPEN